MGNSESKELKLWWSTKSRKRRMKLKLKSGNKHITETVET